MMASRWGANHPEKEETAMKKIEYGMFDWLAHVAVMATLAIVMVAF